MDNQRSKLSNWVSSHESGRGLPQSMTLTRYFSAVGMRQLLECGSPLPLSLQLQQQKRRPEFLGEARHVADPLAKRR